MDGQCNPIAVVAHREYILPHQGIAILIGMVLGKRIRLRIVKEKTYAGRTDPDLAVFAYADSTGTFAFDVILVSDGLIVEFPCFITEYTLVGD